MRLFGVQPSAPAGAEAPAKRELVKLVVVGPSGDEQSASAAAGSGLLAVSGKMRKPIASGCADSTCGTCRVEVLEGAENLAPPDEREVATLRASGHPSGWRLSCRAELLRGEAKVRAFELI